VIGTPGRLKDLINRGIVDTRMFTNVVLDEVDRMLDIGFRQDIRYLISKLPLPRHSAFFSATMNRETEEIMHEFLTDPAFFSVKTRETASQIDQDIVRIQPGQNKVDVLHDLLTQKGFDKVLVFGRTKHGVNKLEEELSARGFHVTSIHGNKRHSARQRSLDEFKRGHVQALLATDVAARGIDIENVTHVINYDEPQSFDDYVHRIGRTGRAGKVGKALTFV
jgi:superfamily II DNA/RNA helicase